MKTSPQSGREIQRERLSRLHKTDDRQRQKHNPKKDSKSAAKHSRNESREVEVSWGGTLHGKGLNPLRRNFVFFWWWYGSCGRTSKTPPIPEGDYVQVAHWLQGSTTRPSLIFADRLRPSSSFRLQLMFIRLMFFQRLRLGRSRKLSASIFSVGVISYE